MNEKERKFHRKVAVDCFNKAWSYLDKKQRSARNEREMLLLAHTSRYHWGKVGNARNLAVGDWQISRVYAKIGQAELGVLFARAALVTCGKNKLVDLLPSAYEGMARAYAVARQIDRAREFVAMARRRLRLLTDIEDRQVYGEQIADTEMLILKNTPGQNKRI